MILAIDLIVVVVLIDVLFEFVVIVTIVRIAMPFGFVCLWLS